MEGFSEWTTKTGELIRSLRKRLGLTQIELAARLSISNVTISRWEHGMHVPTGSTLVRLRELEAGAEVEPLYSIMAQCLEAMRNCLASENTEWYDVWQEVLNDCVEYLPRGSGFDDYPVLDEEVSGADKLAFIGAYHALDENGSYKDWINYRVIVTPSFITGIKLTVKYVRDTSLREYIADCFNDALHDKRDRNEMIADVRRKLLPG